MTILAAVILVTIICFESTLSRFFPLLLSIRSEHIEVGNRIKTYKLRVSTPNLMNKRAKVVYF